MDIGATAGASSSANNHGGGGGGGWYGGGMSTGEEGGGGGSSYLSSMLMNSGTVDGDSFIDTNVVPATTGRVGNGYAKISFVP